MHDNKETLIQLQKHLDNQGILKPYKTCACAKMKQKNINKQSMSKRASMPNGHVYLDLAKIKINLQAQICS